RQKNSSCATSSGVRSATAADAASRAAKPSAAFAVHAAAPSAPPARRNPRRVHISVLLVHERVMISARCYQRTARPPRILAGGDGPLHGPREIADGDDLGGRPP